MIGWLAIMAWGLGWFLLSPLAARHKATAKRWACPQGNSGGYCARNHEAGCRGPRDRVTVGDMCIASGITLAWPLAMPIVVMYYMANRKPLVPPNGKDLALRIQELEREVGISDVLTFDLGHGAST